MVIGDEGLAATDATWEARARARGRTQILQAQKGWLGSEEEQGGGRVVRRDAGFSLYPTHRPAWSIHDSVSEWG